MHKREEEISAPTNGSAQDAKWTRGRIEGAKVRVYATTPSSEVVSSLAGGLPDRLELKAGTDPSSV